MSLKRWSLGLLCLTALGMAAALVVWLNLRGEAPLESSNPVVTEDMRTRGSYLARAGNCMACHTQVGGAAYAGGRGIETPFGVIFSSNLTPAPDTGLGRWSAAEFWRALHHGRSRDGRLLYPAFPYPNYTYVRREDSDAIWAYLQSLPPVEQTRPDHALRYPYSTQAALAVWRALFFRPATMEADASRTPEWNRGAYLVVGLGHCAACHSPRNAWGASAGAGNFAGGMIPMQNWYAPALDKADEASLAGWPLADAMALLRHGVSPQASVSGPMAEVVFRSTQYLSEADARAMAVYLQALPQRPVSAMPGSPAPAAALERGRQIYEQHCAQCHGPQGQGAPGAFAPLVGNRAVLMSDTTNLVRMVLHGGYAPATQGNPRPHGMQPFLHVLSDEDIAAVVSYVRNSWGNNASGVGTMAVFRARERQSP